MSEKGKWQAAVRSNSSTPEETNPAYAERTHDVALDFIRQQGDAINAELFRDPVYARRLRRKVDLLVMPFLMLCYVMNFLDKVLLNYAVVMGLAPALQLEGNNFSNASSAFYIAVLIAMIPNIWLLQKLPVGKWLGYCLAGWGISTACHAALHNYAGLLAVRIFSGICEAAVPSALMLLSSQWYTRGEQSTRFSYWYCGMGIGQILGGLFSWAFQHVSPTASFAGWRIMFVAIGGFTLLLGAAIIFAVPDTPMAAYFLTAEEKVNLLEHVKVNQAGIQNRKFMPYQIKEGLLDFQLWCMFLIVMLQGTGGGAIVAYSATLLTSFGYTPQQAALLNMPSGVLNICSALFCGFMSRYFGRRWLWTVLVTCLGVMGASLMGFIKNNQSGSLAGIYLANLIIGATPVDYQWITNNTAGHTKRAFVTAMMNAAFAVGNIIGPLTFRASEAPVFQSAKISLVCCWSMSAVLALVLVSYYIWANKRRDAKSQGIVSEVDEVSETKAFAGLTDRQNKEFRYTY